MYKRQVSQLITAVFLTRVLQQAMCDIRNALQKKIQRLPVRYFDDHAFGDVLSCVTNDVDTLSNALQETLQRVLAAILTFIFVIGMMFYIHTILACIAILIIPLSLIVTRFFVTRSQKLFDTQQETLGELNGTITEMYGGFNEIILYNRQKMALDKFHDVNDLSLIHILASMTIPAPGTPAVPMEASVAVRTTVSIWVGVSVMP